MSIYVITHKYIENRPKISNFYKWLYVGAYKQNNKKNGYLYDDEGKNISKKNANFCELTGVYWVAHNCEDDIKGIVHYRRFFTHNVWSEKEENFYKESDIRKILEKYDCIVSDRMYFSCGNIRNHYKKHHYAKDLELLKDVISYKCPEYLEAFEIAMSKNYLFPYNMIIAKKNIFNDYANWLLGLLLELEKNENISGYDMYQSRVYGFLSERLMNVWLVHNNIKYKELPTVQLGSRVRYKIRTRLEKHLKMSLHFLAMIDAIGEKNEG